MKELQLYRMPDERVYDNTVYTWILALNGIQISSVTTTYGDQSSAFGNMPGDLMGLAMRLESALNVTMQHHDRRIKPAVRLHVVKS